jgi:hypothetical protein
VGDQYLTLPDTTLPAVAHETVHAAEGHVTISHDDHHVTISHAATGSPSTEHHSRGARHAEHTHSDLNGHITISHQADPGRPPHPAGGELVGLLGAQGMPRIQIPAALDDVLILKSSLLPFSNGFVYLTWLAH